MPQGSFEVAARSLGHEQLNAKGAVPDQTGVDPRLTGHADHPAKLSEHALAQSRLGHGSPFSREVMISYPSSLS
jgi:hypothetical protein